jgi:NADPH:quinone reductase-like Zn-dependent oxidoreductase
MHLLRPFKHISYTSRAFARASVRPCNPQLPITLAARMSSSMAQRLKGKTIVITGASSGIGKSTALEFARTQPDDLKLILTARREDALKEVAKEIEGFAKGVKVLPVKLDVSKVEEIEAFVGNLPQEFQNVDVLVNNAYALSSPRSSSFELSLTWYG